MRASPHLSPASGPRLHWEARDADLSIAGLLAGLFGNKACMAGTPDRARVTASAGLSAVT